MKNLAYLALSTVLFASIAQANTMENLLESAARNDNKTYYETLEDLFAKGTKLVVPKVVDRAWSGRCFNSLLPYSARNGGYMLLTVPNDAGPIFDEQLYSSSAYTVLEKDASFFDDKGMKEVMDIKRNNKDFEYRHTWPRMSGDYLVAEFSIYDINFMCYYYISNP